MVLSKPRPCLQDMPEHVKTAIIEGFSFRERFPIRLLSSEFKNLSDSLKMRERLKIYVHPDQVWFALDDPMFRYKDCEGGCLRNGQLIPGVNFEDAALAHLDVYTSKPKLTFWKLTIKTPSLDFYDNRRFMNKFKAKYSNSPLQVEYLELNSSNCTEKEFLDFAPFMDPLILTSLEYGPLREIRHQAVVVSSQWMNLTLLNTGAEFLSRLPLESYSHIPDFEISMQEHFEYEWTIGLFKQWLHSPIFKSALISRSPNIPWITDLMRQEREWQIFQHGSNNLLINWTDQKCLCLKTIGGQTAKVTHWTIEQARAFVKRWRR